MEEYIEIKDKLNYRNTYDERGNYLQPRTKPVHFSLPIHCRFMQMYINIVMLNSLVTCTCVAGAIGWHIH
jgi:hypothetical protein